MYKPWLFKDSFIIQSLFNFTIVLSNCSLNDLNFNQIEIDFNFTFTKYLVNFFYINEYLFITVQFHNKLKTQIYFLKENKDHERRNINTQMFNTEPNWLWVKYKLPRSQKKQNPKQQPPWTVVKERKKYFGKRRSITKEALHSMNWTYTRSIV